jgi:hypothetical protein
MFRQSFNRGERRCWFFLKKKNKKEELVFLFLLIEGVLLPWGSGHWSWHAHGMEKWKILV